MGDHDSEYQTGEGSLLMEDQDFTQDQLWVSSVITRG